MRIKCRLSFGKVAAVEWRLMRFMDYSPPSHGKAVLHYASHKAKVRRFDSRNRILLRIAIVRCFRRPSRRNGPTAIEGFGWCVNGLYMAKVIMDLPVGLSIRAAGRR